MVQRNFEFLVVLITRKGRMFANVPGGFRITHIVVNYLNNISVCIFHLGTHKTSDVVSYRILRSVKEYNRY